MLRTSNRRQGEKKLSLYTAHMGNSSRRVMCRRLGAECADVACTPHLESLYSLILDPVGSTGSAITRRLATDKRPKNEWKGHR